MLSEELGGFVEDNSQVSDLDKNAVVHQGEKLKRTGVAWSSN